jgi:hypothetical protein
VVPGAVLPGAFDGVGGKWLRTPLGWARANIWYDHLGRLPRLGTWQESLAVLVFIERQEQRLAAVQVGVASPKGVHDALEAFANSLFPYREGMQKKAKVEQSDVLKRWVEQGPIKITPLVDVRPDRGVREQQLRRGMELQKREGTKSWQAAVIRKPASSTEHGLAKRAARLPEMQRRET